MNDAQIPATWQNGDKYENFIGRWSRKVAPLFVSWLDIPAGRRWLDVGCGTGALSAAIIDNCSPMAVTGVEPSEGFLHTARNRLDGKVTLKQGSATEIPLPDAAVDVAVSGLVLNFVADQRAALAEMARVTARGGTIAAYVWDYPGKMEMLRFFWDVAVELNPEDEKFDEGVHFPVCRRGGLAELFTGAGLQDIVQTAIDIPTRFASFDDYWQPFLAGQGVAPAYVVALGETARERLRDRLHRRLPLQADGSLLLTARAWSVRATVAK